MFKPDDRVTIKRSRAGYQGPATVVDYAYGSAYLVRTDTGRLITAKFQDMAHLKESAIATQKKKKKGCRDPGVE